MRMPRDNIHEIRKLDPEDIEFEEFRTGFVVKINGLLVAEKWGWFGNRHWIAELTPERANVA